MHTVEASSTADIKPENILLQDSHAVVADSGIALAMTTAGGARLTQTGLSVGKTPADRWRSASEFADALSHADAVLGAVRTPPVADTPRQS